jgi:hypothetical protein
MDSKMKNVTVVSGLATLVKTTNPQFKFLESEDGTIVMNGTIEFENETGLFYSSKVITATLNDLELVINTQNSQYI